MRNSGAIQMGLGLVGIAIAFIIFPIVLTGVASVTSHTHIAAFTGLSDVANIAPLVIFVGLLFGGGFGMYRGYKALK